jgi:NTE family protein
MLLRLTQGKDSLLPSESLLHFIRKWDLAEREFREFVHPRLYVVAARLADGAMRVFGDDPHDCLLDGLMASTALPPLFPPWVVDGVAYVDGGVVSDLPLSVAVERGADEIYALMITTPQPSSEANPPRGVLAIGGRALSVLADRTAEYEMDTLRDHYPSVRLHLIRLWPDEDPGFWNFAHAEALVAAGKRAAILALAQEAMEARPIPGWRERLRRWLRRK